MSEKGREAEGEAGFVICFVNWCEYYLYGYYFICLGEKKEKGLCLPGGVGNVVEDKVP